jgi:hypothetical protein
MMKTPAFWVVLQWIVATGTVQAQSANASTRLPWLRRYVTNVQVVGQSRQERGVLFAVTDSTLTLAPIKGLKSRLQTIVNQHGGTMPPIDSLGYFLPLRTYTYNQISRLGLRRRGHALKGMLIGAGLGMILGFADGDDPPSWFSFSASDKAIIYGIVFAPVGAVGSLFNVKNVDAKRKSVATEMQGRLRRFAIIEQLKKTDVYRP